MPIIDPNTAQSLLTAIIPALGPYGAAIGLGISVLEKVAPPVYNEIVSLIHQIQNGNTVTDEDLAKLAGLVAQLKNPDAYFTTPRAKASVVVPDMSLPPVS